MARKAKAVEPSAPLASALLEGPPEPAAPLAVAEVVRAAAPPMEGDVEAVLAVLVCWRDEGIGERLERAVSAAWPLARAMAPGERRTHFVPFGNSRCGAVIGKSPKGAVYLRYGIVPINEVATAWDVIVTPDGGLERGLSGGREPEQR